MIEQLRIRLTVLIVAENLHVNEMQQYHPGDEGYDPDFPSFADDDDRAYYYRLRGHIEEVHYLLELLGWEATTGTTGDTSAR